MVYHPYDDIPAIHLVSGNFIYISQVDFEKTTFNVLLNGFIQTAFMTIFPQIVIY